jgi:hypothetical protein
MEELNEIKRIAKEALEKEQFRKGLQDILWFIAQEEEAYKIRKEFYGIARRY